MANEFRIKKGLIVNETDLYVSGGGVGIGTSNPDVKLHIDSDPGISQGTVLKVENSGDYGSARDIHIYNQYDRDIGIFFETLGGINYIYQDSNGDDSLIFTAGGYIRGTDDTLILYQNHNVEIPNGSLTVSGDLTVGGIVTAQEFHTEFVSASIIYQSGSTKFGDTSDDVHAFTGSLQQSGSNSYFLGNVGIGTDDPNQKLEIRDTAPFLRITTTLDDDLHELGREYGGIEWYTEETYGNAPVVAAYVKAIHTRTGTGHTNGDMGLVFATGTASSDATATERMRIQSETGNVGIGTTSPNQKLTVAGNISSSGNLDIDGTATVDGVLNVNSYIYIDRADERMIVMEDNGGSNTGYLTMNDSQGNMQLMLGIDGAGHHVETSDGAAKLLFTAHGQDGVLSMNAAKEGTANADVSFSIGLSVDSNDNTVKVGASSDNVGLDAGVGNTVFDASGNLYTENIYARNANGLNILDDGGTLGIFVEDGGNIGIGTTSPTAKLHVEGGSGLSNLSVNDTFFIAGAVNSLNLAIDDNEIQVRNNGSADDLLLQKNGGNVGIGIISPLQKLHVADSENPTILIEDTNLDNQARVEFKTATYNWVTGLHGGENAFKISNNSTFGTNDFLTVKDTGKVGIGTTSPATKLHIKETSGGVGLVLQSEDDQNATLTFGETSDVSRGAVKYDNSNDSMAFEVNNLQEAMRIDSSGNVGIGTDSPGAQLHISESNGREFKFLGGSIGHAFEYIERTGYTTGAANFYIQDADNANDRATLRITGNNGSVESLFVASSGNVGIGTTSPQVKLHIQGDISGSGTLDIGGIATFNNDVNITNNQLKFNSVSGGSNLIYGQNTAHSLSEFTFESRFDDIAIQAGVNDSNKRDIRIYSGDTKVAEWIVANSFESLVPTTISSTLDVTGIVGIGTTNANAKLHIDNPEAWSAQDLGSSSSGSVAFRITGRNTATNDFIISSNGSTDYTMQVVKDSVTSGELYINPFGGNVGIGTASPDTKLHIAGLLKLDGGNRSYDFRFNERVNGNGQAQDSAEDLDQDLHLTYHGRVDLPANETYATATFSRTFSVGYSGGTRWFAKVKVYDGQSANTPVLCVNDGTEHNIQYERSIEGGDARDDSNTWHLFDITDDVITGTNTIKVYLKAGQKTYLYTLYVFSSTGIQIPNEPYELPVYSDTGFGVKDTLIIDPNRHLSGIISASFDGPVGIGNTNPGNALHVGDGTADTTVKIAKADNDVSDHLIFKIGATRIGEIGAQDTTWLRINQETAKNIYTPRYIRADGGFFVDGTSLGINGDGRLLDGSLTGTYSNNLTFSGTTTFTGNLFADAYARIDALRVGTTSTDPGDGNLYVEGSSTLKGLVTITDDLYPETNYVSNIGSPTKKFLTLNVAELLVETLVASERRSTVGGRFNVGISTQLSQSLSTGTSTIIVENNNLNDGDIIHLEGGGSVEFMKVTSAATNVAGDGYSYTVTRNLDGTGENDWDAGSGIFNTGATGSAGQSGTGFIDQYAINSLTNGVTTAGPTIAFMERTGSAYPDIDSRTIVGNLKGWYGYGEDTFGFASGDYKEQNITVDPFNGLRIRNVGDIQLQASSSFLSIGDDFLYDSSVGKLYVSGSNIDLVSPSFFLGGDSQYVSGSEGSIEISGSNFHLLNGSITASNVDLSGNINANTGTIGGFTISGDALTGSNFYLSGSATSNDFFISASNFNVKANGELTGSRVLLDGGQIGGFDITSDKLSIVNGDFEILQGNLFSNNIGYRVVETAGGNRQINMRYDTADDSLEFLIYQDSNNYFNVGDAYADQYDGWGLNLRVAGDDILKVESQTVTLSGFTATADAFAGNNFYISGSATANDFFISSSNFNVKANGDITGSQVLFTGGKITGSDVLIDVNTLNLDAGSGAIVIDSTNEVITVGGGAIRLDNSFDSEGSGLEAINSSVIRVSADGSGTGTSNYMTMFYSDATNWGMEVYGDSNTIFFAGEDGGTIKGILAGFDFYGDRISDNATGDTLILRSNGQISGSSVLFEGGKIGGFTISDTQITDNGATDLILKSNGQITASAAQITGDITSSAALIKGNSKIAGFEITDTQINNSSGTDLILKSDGQITASAAQITGDITAQTGTIGGFTIGNNVLSNGTTFGISGSSTGDNFFISSSRFNVKANGNLTASNAQILGDITATSGQIAKFSINDTTLQVVTGSSILQLGELTNTDSGDLGLNISGSNYYFDISTTEFVPGGSDFYPRIEMYDAINQAGMYAGIIGGITSSFGAGADEFNFVVLGNGNQKVFSAGAENIFAGFEFTDTQINDTGDNLILKSNGQITGSAVLIDGNSKIAGFEVTDSQINDTGDNLILKSNGQITASAAQITGDITATSGELQTLDISGTLTIGTGGTIENDSITITNSEIILDSLGTTGASSPDLSLSGSALQIGDDSLGFKGMLYAWADNFATDAVYLDTVSSTGTITGKLRLRSPQIQLSSSLETLIDTPSLNVTGDITGSNAIFSGDVGIGTTNTATNLGDDTEPRFVLDGRGYMIDTNSGTNRYRLWGMMEPKPIRPSSITRGEAGNIGTNIDTTRFPNVYGESDLSAIDSDATFTYANAVAAAETHGGRLPTLQEVMAGVGQGSGQGYDAEYIWTQTFAGHNRVWVCRGRFDSYPEAKIVDITDAGEVYRVRAAFDVSKANMSVHYDNNEAIRTNILQAQTGSISVVNESGDGLTVDSVGRLVMNNYIEHNGDDNTYFGFSANDTFVVTTAGTQRLIIDSDGEVGIGVSAAGYKLDVSGDVRFINGALGVNVTPNATTGRIDASNDIVSFSSDKRLKTDIFVIKDPIEKVKSLSGFTFKWNEKANELAGYDNDKTYVGVFAQDVEKVLPQAVKPAPFDNDGNDNSLSGENYLTVQYEKLVPLLIEGMKEQQKQIDELKKIVEGITKKDA